MKIFKSLCEACYKGNDRLSLRMIQADFVNNKLRLCSSNGQVLVSYLFKNIKSNKFYYLPRNEAKTLINEEKFCFKNDKINNIKFIEDGEKIKICDTRTTIGSWENAKADEHFPKVDNVIPTKFKYRFKINRKLLRKALKDETHVTLKITENSLLVYSSKVSQRTNKQTRKSKPKVTIPIKFVDSTFDCTETVLFNTDILKTALCLPYDNIVLEFNTRVTALVVRYEDKQISVINLACPMYITNDSI